MYHLLQPRLDVLLFEVIFPLMCFNDNDQRLWEEDPHEYVRKGYGEFCRLLTVFQSLFILVDLTLGGYALIFVY